LKNETENENENEKKRKGKVRDWIMNACSVSMTKDGRKERRLCETRAVSEDMKNKSQKM
jgi:hypothetical protein